METAFLAVRKRAMGAVLHPDEAFRLRRIRQWYSRTFSTPLHDVERLPLLKVLQIFYEDRYADLVEAADHDPQKEQQLREELRDLLETPEARRERIMQEDQQLDEDEQFALEAEAEEVRQQDVRARKGQAAKQRMEQEVMGVVRAPERRNEALDDATKEFARLRAARGGGKETELPTPKTAAELPPDVKINFVSDDDMKKLLEGEDA